MQSIVNRQNKSSSATFLLTFIVTFTYLIGMKFKNGLDLSLLAAFLLSLFYLKSIRKYTLFISIVILATSITLIVSFIASGAQGDSIVFAFKILIYFLGSLALTTFFIKFYGKSALQYFLLFVFLSVLLHSLVVIIQFINPEFKNFIYNFSDVSPLMYTSVGSYRMAGFSGGGGALLSLFHAIGFLSGILCLKIGMIKSSRFLFGGLVIILSTLFIARTGLLIILLASPFLYFKGMVNFMINASFLAITCGLVILIIGNNDTLWGVWDMSQTAIDRTISEFFSTSNGDESKKFHTFKVLSNMFFIPQMDYIDYIWGTGSTGRMHNDYLKSDVGFIRMFYMGGLVFILLFITLIISSFYICLTSTQALKYEVCFILVIVLLVEMKELVILGRHILPFTLALMFFIINQRRENFE
ncbi:hypothetical protein KO505_07155 [Psychrosphaera sp. F3M07]|uniref:hypothetical protein n=1 Tax=Psychrosphaera sp. F3M07 TaxID=2841560 RepID=UPI001C099F1C|nr:hypothetical protein [Psychrosphaera sp. F3M07]MBU2917739.1 hypothetical protein [Psychrosphaera sp. F3M07]